MILQLIIVGFFHFLISNSPVLSIPTCSFNVLTRMISKRVSALVISGDFRRLFKSCCFSPTRILLPLHARLFLPLSWSTNCAIAAYFPSFSFLTYSLSWLLSHQCMVRLCFGPGARKGWDQMVKGCCVALPLTLCSQPNQSGPQPHLLEMGIDGIKLTAGILSSIFSCFDLAIGL